ATASAATALQAGARLRALSEKIEAPLEARPALAPTATAERFHVAPSGSVASSAVASPRASWGPMCSPRNSLRQGTGGGHATVIPEPTLYRPASVSQIPAAHVMHAALAGRSSRGSLGLPIAQGPKVLMAGGAHAGMRTLGQSRSPSEGPACGSR
ncbi:unnamed protein product, partial [Polarella glacialis]